MGTHFLAEIGEIDGINSNYSSKGNLETIIDRKSSKIILELVSNLSLSPEELITIINSKLAYLTSMPLSRYFPQSSTDKLCISFRKFIDIENTLSKRSLQRKIIIQYWPNPKDALQISLNQNEYELLNNLLK